MWLSESDPEIAKAIQNELGRQQMTLDLIASENYASPAVLIAQGSVLTNKYAEGYPGDRYYGGCRFVDVVESLAIERAKALFGAEYANVQPHAGAQANAAAYQALLNSGDRVLGLSLAHGGHLTHGKPSNLSGQIYDFAHYHVARDTELIDYDEVARLAVEHRPKLIVTGASAYPRLIDFALFRKIADSVGAMLMVDMAHIAGLVAAGVHPSPIPYADVVTTTTHKTLRGPRAGLILAREKYGKAIDKAIFPGSQGGPMMHVIAAKAVCFKEATTEEFRDYSRRIVSSAKKLAKTLALRNFRIISGGTDNHMVLVDLTNKGITGVDAEARLESAGIAANKNTIPFETRSPKVTSGIRLGTPAMTTRGMGEKEAEKIAFIIADVLDSPEDGSVLARASAEVRKLCEDFPIYAGLTEGTALYAPTTRR
ncbi:MAG: serine hydroxymethyltransferase [Actinobacteria bacterium]|nr:serine hydroxymethyltransferase [Actinomycetota bacterium]